MPKLPKRCFKQRKPFQAYYRDTHTAGALDAKTKELMPAAGPRGRADIFGGPKAWRSDHDVGL